MNLDANEFMVPFKTQTQLAESVLFSAGVITNPAQNRNIDRHGLKMDEMYPIDCCRIHTNSAIDFDFDALATTTACSSQFEELMLA